MSKWEIVLDAGIAMDRFPVPGGWIYRVVDEITFVPKVTSAHSEASPAMGKVIIGTKVLFDLVDATTDLLQSAKRRVPNIILVHECDVAHIALNNLSEYMRSGAMPEGEIRDRSNELSEASIG